MAKRGNIDYGNAEPIRNWFAEESGKDVLKVLYGIRGCGKSTVVDGVIEDLKSQGVSEDNIFRFDFESPEMRHVRTYKDVLAILRSRGTKGRCHVFLEELTSLLDYELLMGVLFGMKEYELTVTTSSRKMFDSDVMSYFKGRLTRRRMFAPERAKRPREELQRVWGKMFLCDVLGGHVLADATAEQRLAEFLSDHMGEVMSFRKISQTMDIVGHKLHPNTVAEYLKSLTDACLIDSAMVYDPFTGEILNVGMRYFWTDLELRDGRFGASPEMESERRKYAEKYLELRRTTRATVMCVKSDAVFADFVIDAGGGKREVVKWKGS